MPVEVPDTCKPQSTCHEERDRLSQVGSSEREQEQTECERETNRESHYEVPVNVVRRRDSLGEAPKSRVQALFIM